MNDSTAASGSKRWLQRLNRSQHALWLISVLSFLETIIIPVPIEVVLIPFMATNRHRIWLIATVTTAGCLVASLVGYGIGMVLYESVGQWFIETMGFQSAYQSFQGFFDRHGFLAIFALGIVPIPFQVAMITAGLSGYPLHLFALAAVLARGLRYYGLAWLVQRFGRRAQELWRRHALLTGIGAAAAVVALVLLSRWLAAQVM